MDVEIAQRSLRWTAPTQSGIGDRLIDVILVLSLARLAKSHLYMVWPEPTQNEQINSKTPHRLVDVKVENISRYINLPSDLTIGDTTTPTTDRFEAGVGGDGNFHNFYVHYVPKEHSFYAFIQACKSTARDIQPCAEIEAWMHTLPNHYAAFHIRRGDKVRSGKSCFDFVSDQDVNRLDEITRAQIDICAAYGIQDYFICGDEDHLTQPFKDYVSKTKGCNVITVPCVEKHVQTFYDLFGISFSSVVYVSTRYSSFSRVAGMIGRTTCMSVYEPSHVWYTFG